MPEPWRSSDAAWGSWVCRAEHPNGEPYQEPDGSKTWVIREYRYGPTYYSREIVSFHKTREEAEAAR